MSIVSKVRSEAQRFGRAALVDQVERDHTETLTALRRRRIIAGVTLVIGAVFLGVSFSFEPGDPLFYLTTLALGATWTVGGLISGPLYLGRARTRKGIEDAVPIVQPIVVGVVILGIFTLGALLIAPISLIREPIITILNHALEGYLPLVIAIAFVNGLAEELFFRGALYVAFPRKWNVIATTLIYTAVTMAAGNLMLGFAALVLGFIVGLERRVTGGILAPMITHVIWSMGMILILPPIFKAFG